MFPSFTTVREHEKYVSQLFGSGKNWFLAKEKDIWMTFGDYLKLGARKNWFYSN